MAHDLLEFYTFHLYWILKRRKPLTQHMGDDLGENTHGKVTMREKRIKKFNA